MEASFAVIVPHFRVVSRGDVRHVGRCPTVSLSVGVRVESPSHSTGRGSPPRAERKSWPQHRGAHSMASDKPPNALHEGLRNAFPLRGKQGGPWEPGPSWGPALLFPQGRGSIHDNNRLVFWSLICKMGVIVPMSSRLVPGSMGQCTGSTLLSAYL